MISTSFASALPPLSVQNLSKCKDHITDLAVTILSEADIEHKDVNLNLIKIIYKLN